MTTERWLAGGVVDVAYVSLADELERSIERSHPGARLPSEHELAARYGVSRITTRAALQELERRHLVHRRRGSGTFVSLRLDYPISADIPPSFTETVARSGHRPGSRMLSVRRVRPSAAVRRSLELDAAAAVLRVRRLFTVDDHVVGSHTSWLARVDLEAIRSSLGDDASVFGLLREQDRQPARQWYTAELETTSAEVADALGLEHRAPAWRTASCNRCVRTGELVELSEAWIRADAVRVRFFLGPSSEIRS